MANFWSFKNGVKISDSEINQWLNDCRRNLLAGERFWNTCSGDTKVIALKYDTSWTFYVCNSEGASEINFYDEDELREYVFNYSRYSASKGGLAIA